MCCTHVHMDCKWVRNSRSGEAAKEMGLWMTGSKRSETAWRTGRPGEWWPWPEVRGGRGPQLSQGGDGPPERGQTWWGWGELAPPLCTALLSCRAFLLLRAPL